MRSLLRKWRCGFRRRRVSTHLRRIEKERKRLGGTLTEMNRCLIMAMPIEERSEWEARREVMRAHLDPDLDRVEEETGWRYPYGAERDNEHRYPQHRNQSEPKGKQWAV